MIYRIDVTMADGGSAQGGAAADPVGESVRQQIREFGMVVGAIRTSRVFLIDTDAGRADVEKIASELLADPVVERAEVGGAVDKVTRGQGDKVREGEHRTSNIEQPTSNVAERAEPSAFSLQPSASSRIEIHLKPGVMDPVAASTEMAIRDMGLAAREVRTGRAYTIDGVVPREQLEQIAARVLANGVIESVHFDKYVPTEFARGHEYRLNLKHVPIRNLSDAELTKLSREAHLFLSLAEMKAIQEYFRTQDREPTDVEVETIAQTWSEHCVHKTLKSAVEVRDESGKVLRRYKNLIKETIFASTQQLMGREKKTVDSRQKTVGEKHSALSTQDSALFCLSVFKDNAGVIAFDEVDAVCFKVETHNHPSAIEPYGGSATGVGGVIRDILGTGLAAKPIANTDVFCVADPNFGRENASLSSPSSLRRSVASSLPKGVIHPKRILQQIVAGVRDYGNRMGIPTINGAVYFDNNYLGNPLVFCGCVGLIPRTHIEKASRAGDAIVVMGGRTGRDGIHGATFSSAELTDTHADEFSHAVQIGNAITEKKVTDVILAARDRGLFTAVTDCGAGGLSSAVGEMGEKIGAAVDLEKVPLKYAGLRHDEIWISEAQERMVLSVPQEKVKELLELSAGEDVESTVIGTFGTKGRELVLKYGGTEVGRLSMEFLHEGIPMPQRVAVVTSRSTGFQPVNHGQDAHATPKEELLAKLAHPNIASKHWIVRQYDHEVQGGSVVKPLTGPRQVGPSDSAVIRPKLSSWKGVAIGCGLTPWIEDPYKMALAAIDEAIRNVVAVGADPGRTAILDNFCWPSVDDERTMGTLVRACEACRDAALAYGIPFISGKDSLHNQFTNQETGEVIRIPNTLLISAIGIIEDVRKCVTMDLKGETDRLLLVRPRGAGLVERAEVHKAVAAAIGNGWVRACHDVSDGGILVAAAEMCIASGFGATLPLRELPADIGPFEEVVGAYLLSVRRADVAAAVALIQATAAIKVVGDASCAPRFIAFWTQQEACDIGIDELTHAWRGTLDW